MDMTKRNESELQYSLTYRDVVEILCVVRDSEFCQSLELEFGDMKLNVTRATGGNERIVRVAHAAPALASDPKSPEPFPPPGARPQAAYADSGLITVCAPMLGTFYRAQSPGVPPFVEVGSTVEADDAIGLIEIMKLFTPIIAGVSGRVVEILVENATLVEHGQPLVLIQPL